MGMQMITKETCHFLTTKIEQCSRALLGDSQEIGSQMAGCLGTPSKSRHVRVAIFVGLELLMANL
jgi:hypothetical protein